MTRGTIVEQKMMMEQQQQQVFVCLAASSIAPPHHEPTKSSSRRRVEPRTGEMVGRHLHKNIRRRRITFIALLIWQFYPIWNAIDRIIITLHY